MVHSRRWTPMIVALMVGGLFFLHGNGVMAFEKDQANAEKIVRISPVKAQALVEKNKALLICAYKDEGICKKVMLEGAVSLTEFESKVPGLAKNRALIFYCA